MAFSGCTHCPTDEFLLGEGQEVEGSASTAAGVSQHLSPTKIKGRDDRVRSPPSLRNKLNRNQYKFLGANNPGSPPSMPEMAMTIKEPRGGLWPFLGPGPAQMAACPRGPSLGSSFPFTPRGRSPRRRESLALPQDPPGTGGQSREGRGGPGRGGSAGSPGLTYWLWRRRGSPAAGGTKARTAWPERPAPQGHFRGRSGKLED